MSANFEFATCKEGIVTATRPGFAKVRFDDLDGLQTDWLPVVTPFAFGDRQVWTLVVGSQVACVMDTHLERGWVVGALYSEADSPPTSNPQEHVVVFADGTRMVYSKTSSTLTLSIGGCVVSLSANGLQIAGGDVQVVGGDVQVDGGDVTADDISLKTHVHGGVVPGNAETGEPV